MYVRQHSLISPFFYQLRILLGHLNLQIAFCWTNTSVDNLLWQLNIALPDVMPMSHAESKKILTNFGLDCACIHAYPTFRESLVSTS